MDSKDLNQDSNSMTRPGKYTWSFKGLWAQLYGNHSETGVVHPSKEGNSKKKKAQLETTDALKGGGLS
jgi:hypothetical protein